MQLIPFLPAVTIPKARQINDFSVPFLILIIDIHCPFSKIVHRLSTNFPRNHPFQHMSACCPPKPRQQIFEHDTPRNSSVNPASHAQNIPEISPPRHCYIQANPRHTYIRKIPVISSITGTLYILSAKSDKRSNFKACEVPKTAVYCCK